jgi:methylated-DNA-[protein]-cysteine S-methyltransferase
MTMNNIRSYPTPLGMMMFSEENGALTAIDLGNASQGIETPILREAHREMDEYFLGKRTAFELSLYMKGTAFQKAVWQALLTIPYGTTLSYMEVAKRAGYPTAFRAVGTAVSRNPLMIIVPCHRVISADGTIGGFAGGVALKRRIMAVESIRNIPD